MILKAEYFCTKKKIYVLPWWSASWLTSVKKQHMELLQTQAQSQLNGKLKSIIWYDTHFGLLLLLLTKDKGKILLLIKINWFVLIDWFQLIDYITFRESKRLELKLV